MEASVQEDRKVDWSVLDADAAYLILIKKPRAELKHLIYEQQPELWRIERALNVPINESLKLEKGWALKNTHELAEIAAIILPSLERAKRELAEMEAEHGKPDDVRKEIEAKVREYEALCKEARVTPSFYYPKGYKGMNSKQLRDHLKAVEGWVEFARKRVHERGAEAERKQREAEIRAQHELEMKRISDERNARRDQRKAEIEGILSGYAEMLTKLLEHPVFRSASIKLPKLELDRFTVEFQLGTLGEEGYQLLLNKARNEIATNQRKLREPMRRAHQSAQSRGLTKLDFESYLKQEGFEHLLK
jgi:hypothetical protein